jgi:hypothetical protein
MAKRFTDTDKWKTPLLKGLEAPYKLLWLYILDDCDHSGIWLVDMDVANIRLGQQIDVNDAISELSDNIIVLDDGDKWFIPEFISFQYGELSLDNRVHKSVIQSLTKHGIEYKGLTRPLQGSTYKDKDKYQDKDKEGGMGETKIPRTIFTPPTEDEAFVYMTEYTNGKKMGWPEYFVRKTSEKFCNFYQMKGWKVGKDAMKDWKAAVRNWVAGTNFNPLESPPPVPVTPKYVPFTKPEDNVW